MKFVRTYQRLILANNFFLVFLCIFFFISFPDNLYGLEKDKGKSLFNNHCAGCHINGGNIIRRSKNLKFSSLKRNGIDNPEEIAKIARQGVGIMEGYENQLGKNGDIIVADWIWEQAQNAWTQG